MVEGGMDNEREEEEEGNEEEEEEEIAAVSWLDSSHSARLSRTGGTKAPRQAGSPLSPLSMSRPHRYSPTSSLEYPQFTGISAWRAEGEIAEAVITLITRRGRKGVFTSCDALYGS